MAVGSKSLQFFLLFYHILFLLMALGMLVASSLALSGLMAHKAFVDGDMKTSSDVAKRNVNTREGTVNLLGPPSLLVAASALSAIVAGFGFCASLKRNRHTLTALFFMTLVLLLMELAAGIWALAIRHRSKSALRTALYHQFEDYEFGITSIIKDLGRKGDEKPYDHPWDILQSQLNCCGVEGPGDYLKKAALPMSCCSSEESSADDKSKEGKSKEGISPTSLPALWCPSIKQNGCLGALESYVSEYLAWVGIYGIIAAFVNAVGSMFIVMFIYSIKRDLEKIYR
ncbi:hypothetical protein J437_LFUL018445 [Ladona fulva]|uniref:Tetraspanin n=1 Tax=Ladona fulva TaxID=123851 RepID=A0A8K0KTE5_LADFU|nr:hypothetical protein J437_LFUL018445 [Ladona fulva]